MVQNQVIIFLVLIVSVISLLLTIVGLLSYNKVRDSRILFVTLAFGAFFLKNFLIALSLAYNLIAHGDLELIGSLFDLVTIILLFIPIFKKPKNNISIDY